MRRLALACAIGAGLISCDATEDSASRIRVQGSAELERAAEIFRITVRIEERGPDRVAALAAASSKVDAIGDALGQLRGLSAFRITASDASTTRVRPRECQIGDAGFVTPVAERPEDCAPIESAAIATFTIEGEPAAAAGVVLSYLTDADVERASFEKFDVRDREAARLEVKQAALADAMTTARALAEQAGVEIRSPSQIEYGGALFAGRALGGVVAFQTVSSQSIAPTVSFNLPPPVVSFESSVTVEFDILNADGE